MTSFMAIFACQKLVFDVLCKLAKSLAQNDLCPDFWYHSVTLYHQSFIFSTEKIYIYVILKRTIKINARKINSP